MHMYSFIHIYLLLIHFVHAWYICVCVCVSVCACVYVSMHSCLSSYSLHFLQGLTWMDSIYSKMFTNFLVLFISLQKRNL
jgi:hypothetical protein